MQRGILLNWKFGKTVSIKRELGNTLVHYLFNCRNWMAHSSTHCRLKTRLLRLILHATRKAEEIRKRKSRCALEKRSIWIYLQWGEYLSFRHFICQFIYVSGKDFPQFYAHFIKINNFLQNFLIIFKLFIFSANCKE